MVTYLLSMGNDEQLHVHGPRGGKRSRCGRPLSDPEAQLNDADTKDVVRLLSAHNRGCYDCLSAVMGLPRSAIQHRRK